MKKILLFLILFLGINSIVDGQTLRGAGFVDFANSIDLTNYGVQTYMPNKEIKGSSLLFSSSQVGYIVFKNKVRSNMTKLNFDQFNSMVIVEQNENSYALPVEYMDSVIIVDFLNHDVVSQLYVTITIDENAVLVQSLGKSGQIELFKYTKYGLKKPSYNAALDTGSKDYTFTTKVKYVIKIVDEITVLPRKKKQLINNENLDKGLRKFFKKNPCNLTNESELLEFIDKYNNKLSSNL